MADFNFTLLTEDLDRSLAVLSVLFCIDIEDLLYVQVNQRNDFYAKERFLDYPVRIQSSTSLVSVYCHSSINPVLETR